MTPRAAALAGALAAALSTAAAAQTPPNPILYFTGTEHYSANGKNWIRYRYDVFNKDGYPADMFAAAPSLPPCGMNANASRSWVDVFDGRTNRRLYGFCALGTPANLGSIWFAGEEGTLPPSWIYIEIHDRQTGKKYRSNLADTVM
ncbi:MAG: hypothetical protein ACK40O_07505 [Allosphingosinicella sp.]